MKIKHIACIAAISLASLSGLKAQTTLAAWNFNQLAAGANSSPAPATGLGSATALGMANTYNGTSVSSPDIELLTGSSAGGTNAWQILGTGGSGTGWSTAAPIGSQGAQFNASTFGYYRVMVSFDVNATATAEANLQVQYTTDGSFWWNATNINVGGTATLATNLTTANGTNATEVGTYVTLASGWNNQIVADLSGISGVDNNANFAVRLVNASTGTNDVDTTGAVYNNTSGSWAFNNVSIQGVSIDTLADWTFASYGSGGQFSSQSKYVENPIPEINFAVNGAATAACIGFNTSYNFGGGNTKSTNAPDVTSTGGTSTPSNPYMWRLRGAPGNGWFSASAIGTQGSEYDVNTVNYSNIVITMDIYFTSQAEAKMCVLYTTNGWTNSFTANSFYYPANPTFVQTNDQSISGDDNTVDGTYFYETTGQNTYDNFVVDFTGIPNVANNPYFGIRVVNAATLGDDVAYNGLSYNNNSGNCRMGNVSVGGHYEGLVPPALTAQANATVDNPFTNALAIDNPLWRASISAIYVNGAAIPSTAYNATVPGELIFNPAQTTVLQVDQIDNIAIYATNYSLVRVTQPLLAGAFRTLSVTNQPAGPTASGGTLTSLPALALTDKYGNTTTNPYANVTVTASTGGATTWVLGGATNQSEVNGVIQFTNLSATLTGSALVSSATITLQVNNFTNSATLGTTTNISLTSFSIGAVPVPFTPGNIAILQVDSVANAPGDNTTFSIVEIKPSAAGQTTPVNVVPVSATSSNALREATSGTTGRLSLSYDGTLLCFDAFADGNGFTPDETFNLNRAAVGMNSSNQVTIGATYVSTSLGGSQARSAVTVDDQNYFVDDKGGLYYGTGFMPAANVDADNNVVVKAFNTGASEGSTPTIYVETQKVPQGGLLGVIYNIGQPFGTEPGDNPVVGNNLPTDADATDFYLLSTNGGLSYDILYTCDQTVDVSNNNIGTINKYSWVSGVYEGGYGWVANGSWTNYTDVDGMFAATNGVGGAYIYYTSGTGGTAKNSVYRITDTNGWNAPIAVTTSNLIYTTSANASLKGLTFVPQYVASSYEPIPPPILTAAAAGTQTNSTFIVTTTPDDAQWRSDITAVYVNGNLLPGTAYSTTTAGKITFLGAQSTLLQEGTNNIAIVATGYSTNSIAQVLIGVASQLVVTTQPSAPKFDGSALATQPVVAVEDSGADVLSVSSNITATASQNTWSLAGNSAIVSKSGVTTYTNLMALSSGALNNVTITFTSGPLTATSSAFNIPAPVNSVLHKANLVNGKFTFAFTNYTGLSYSVLATNLVNAPVSTWPVIGTTVESPAGSGSYSFTNSTSNAQMYYILRQNP